MLDISHWTDIGDKVAPITLVANSDLDVFLELVSEEQLAKPKFLLSCMEKLSDEFPVFLKYLQYSRDIKINFNSQFDISFFNYWESLCQGKRNLTAIPHPPQILKNASKLIELINKNIRLYDDIVYSSPFHVESRDDFRSDWWNISSHSLLQYKQFRDKIEEGATWLDNDIEKIFLPKINAIIDVLEQLESDDQLMVASALCFVQGVRAKELSAFDASVLLLHRSLDFALQHIAKSERIVQLANSGLRYANNHKHQKRAVSLLLTFNQLTDSNNVLLLSNETERIVKDLNQTRNRLRLTHSMFSLSEDDTGTLFEEVKNVLVQLDEELWQKTVSSLLKARCSIEPFWIFQAEDDFESLFRIQKL